MKEPVAPNAFLRSIQTALTETDGQVELVTLGLCVMGFLIVVLIAARYLNPETRRRGPEVVDYLTVAVDMLGLTEQDRRDLLRIARVSALETPASMLLSPGNFAAAVHHPGVVDRDAKLLARMEDLCQRLFQVKLPVPRKQAKP